MDIAPRDDAASETAPLLSSGTSFTLDGQGDDELTSFPRIETGESSGSSNTTVRVDETRSEWRRFMNTGLAWVAKELFGRET